MVAAWLALIAVASSAAGHADRPPGVDIAVDLRPVSANIWRVVAPPETGSADNAGLTIQLVVVRDDSRIWLVGSGPTPAFGEALARVIRQRLGRSVTDVINSRAAPELAMGNIAFATARVWALGDVIDAMHARCRGCLARLKAQLGTAGASLLPERIRIASQAIATATEDHGSLGPFEWHALLRAPGERALVLRHRADGVVIAQGLFWPGDVPDLRETRSATLLESLHRLRELADGSILLGEQGDPAGPEVLTGHIGYLQALRAATALEIERGSVDAAAGAGLPLPGFSNFPGYAERHPLNVQHVWRELEPQIFR